MKQIGAMCLMVACLGLVLLANQGPVLAEKVGKAVITVQHKAESDGEVNFAFTPEGGAEKKITVKVMAKMKPHEIAGDIVKEFTLALGQAYKIKIKEENKVVIQPTNQTTTFQIAVANQTATGLQILIK